MKEEGNENVTNCHSLKMTVADGKKRMTLLLNDRKAESGRVGNMLFLQNCKLTEIWEKVCFWGCVKAGNEKLYRIYTD